MSDYQPVTIGWEAGRRAAALEGEGLYWMKSPLARRLLWPCPNPARYQDPRPDRRELVGTARCGQEHRGGCLRLSCARPMKIGGVTGWLRAAASPRGLQGFHSRAISSRRSSAPSRSEPHEALAGVRRLGHPDPRGADQDTGWLCHGIRCGGDRHFLGRGSCPTLLGG